MFSSNQIIDISTEFKTLPQVIQGCMKLYGDDMFLRSDGRVHIAFAEPVDGIYMIGTGSMEDSSKVKGHSCHTGWTDYPFDYDPEIIAKIVEQWARKQQTPIDISTDGSVHRGVRVRSMHSLRQSIPELHRCYDSAKWDCAPTILTFTPAGIVYHK